MSLRTLILVLLTGLLAGCQIWKPGGTSHTDSKGRFTLMTPAGWQYATTLGADFRASKDGPILQQMWIEHKELAKALPNSKRPIAATLDPFQLAEALIGDFQADRELVAFALQENVPATVGGVPGCKLTFTYQTSEKLRLTETLYACIKDGHLWTLRFRAPSRHYHARDLPTFEATANSFSFGKS